MLIFPRSIGTYAQLDRAMKRYHFNGQRIIFTKKGRERLPLRAITDSYEETQLFYLNAYNTGRTIEIIRHGTIFGIYIA